MRLSPALTLCGGAAAGLELVLGMPRPSLYPFEAVTADLSRLRTRRN